VFTGDYTEPIPAPAPAPASGAQGAQGVGADTPAGGPPATTAGKPGGTGTAPAKAKLAARLTRSGKRKLVVSGTGPASKTVAVTLLQGKRTVATKRVKTSRSGAFRVTFPVKKQGAYSARATVRSAGKTLIARTSAARAG
jgi:hypothetical protein